MMPDGGDLRDGAFGKAPLQGARQPVHPVNGLQCSVCGLLLSSCTCNTPNSFCHMRQFCSLKHKLAHEFRLTCAITSSNLGILEILKKGPKLKRQKCTFLRWFVRWRCIIENALRNLANYALCCTASKEQKPKATLGCF
jgi:hypothetical protein